MNQKIHTNFYKAASLLLIIIAYFQTAHADNWEVPHIQVSGLGTIEIEPQLLRWQIEIKNEGSDITTLANLHNNDVARALKKIMQLGVLEKKMQTSRPRLTERYVRKDNNNVKDGFVASTQIAFELTEIDKYHEVWLLLSNIKGLRIHNSSWGIEASHQLNLMAKARTLALNNAKEKAIKMANDLSMDILNPLKISDTSTASPYRSHERMSFASDAMTAHSSASHATGTIKVNVSVNVTFEMTPID